MLDPKEPYIDLVLISKCSTFVAKKAKMFEEEREVAEKAPVDGIQINDLNIKVILSFRKLYLCLVNKELAKIIIIKKELEI